MIGPVLLAIGLATSGGAGEVSWQSGGVSRLLLVTGLAGEPQFARSFADVGGTIADAAKERWGLADSNVVYLAENPAADPKRITGRATKDAVIGALARFASGTGNNDVVVIVLMGHGSDQTETGRLSLPGPDLSAEDLALALAGFKDQTVVVVNAASSSGGFIKPLSGRRRIIVTATKTSLERNATLFGGFFAKALATDEADGDKNGRVSVAEAYRFAKKETVRAYESDNRLLTEHSQLDDNGDGVGSPDPTANGDGAVAQLVAFSLTKEETPSDPRVAALVAERRRLETAIAGLRGRKAAMDSTAYETELEGLLVKLAETNQAIRAAQGRPR
ncbi:MAG: C13 family peptidase [Gemmatimonadales bacterium]